MRDRARGGRSWPAAVLLAACVVAAAGPAAAQKEGKPPELPPPVDPYTGGEREALDRAGYVSFGPFQFGDGHSSAKVEEVLGFPLVWVETAHFKLGSSLEKYPLKDAEPDEREKLRDELARLREKLPAVKTKPRELDSWLRLHLFAMRLEELYADFAGRFAAGVEFPAAGAEPGNLGRGPYLGQPDKFSVLLFERESTYGRFSAHFLGQTLRVPIRHNFHTTGSLFYGMCVDPLEGGYASDTAVHCSVVAGVVHNLVDGFRYYGHDPPLWWREGLGHFYSRRIHGRWNVFTGKDDGRIEDEDAWEWEPRVHGRVKFGVFPAWAEMLAWSDPAVLTRADHMIAWSRIEYLLGREGTGAAAFMMAVKEPRTPGTRPAPETVLERQRQALAAAWGATPEELEQAWVKHVLERYPAR
jgi:hypothetical protein